MQTILREKSRLSYLINFISSHHVVQFLYFSILLADCRAICVITFLSQSQSSPCPLLVGLVKRAVVPPGSASHMDLPLHVAQNVLEPLTELSAVATQSEQTVATSPTTVNNNNKRQTARGDASYPRKRANTACQVCRARKTKCDNRKPRCSFCERVGARCISSSSADLST